MKTITFDKRHEGLGGAVNGGYLTGVLAEAAGTDGLTVWIRRPVPVGEPVNLFAENGWAAIRHCDRTLVETTRTSESVSETAFVPVDEAISAEPSDLGLEMFADCFVCGRGAPEGLGVEPRRLEDGRFAAVWHPATSDLIAGEVVPAEYLHAALDCPGGFAVLTAAGQPALTGSMTDRVDFFPRTDQRLIVVGEAGAADGRKLQAITTIFTESGETVATSEAIWVTLRDAAVDSAA